MCRAVSAPNDVGRAEHLFATGHYDAILDLASEFWSAYGSTEPGAAEIARYARIAAYRVRPTQDDLWQARAVSSACATGSWRSLALSLQQYFFRLLGSGEYGAAEAVLDEMEMLAQSGHVGPPAQDLLVGILAERRALLHIKREEWPQATECYSRALAVCLPGERRELKVQGGMAWADWLGGGTDETAARAFERLVEASEAFPDVNEAAKANLAAARAGDRSRAIPFDLL